MRFVIRPPTRRQWRHLVIAAAIVVTVAGGTVVARGPVGAKAWPIIEQQLILATAQVGFRVRAVEVEGRDRASGEAILQALGVARGTPIFAVDPAAAKLRLEQVPWLRTASIYRRLPDTLHIKMTEQEPLAFWQRGDHLVLIDRTGKPIVTRDLGAYSRLPVLVGDDAPANAEDLMAMLASEPHLALKVSAAVRIGGRRWNIEFKNGVAVALPEDDSTGAWRRLAAIEQDHRVLERDVQLVDLRLPDRVYLRLPPDAMPKPAPKAGHHSGKPA